MKAWNEIKHYAGFDWAKDHHDVIVLDAGGKTVADFVSTTLPVAGMSFGKKLAAFPTWRLPSRPSMARSSSDCWNGMHGVPVHTRSAKGYRQRKSAQRQQDR